MASSGSAVVAVLLSFGVVSGPGDVVVGEFAGIFREEPRIGGEEALYFLRDAVVVGFPASIFVGEGVVLHERDFRDGVVGKEWPLTVGGVTSCRAIKG